VTSSSRHRVVLMMDLGQPQSTAVFTTFPVVIKNAKETYK